MELPGRITFGLDKTVSFKNVSLLEPHVRHRLESFSLRLLAWTDGAPEAGSVIIPLGDEQHHREHVSLRFPHGMVGTVIFQLYGHQKKDHANTIRIGTGKLDLATMAVPSVRVGMDSRVLVYDSVIVKMRNVDIGDDHIARKFVISMSMSVPVDFAEMPRLAVPGPPEAVILSAAVDDARFEARTSFSPGMRMLSPSLRNVPRLTFVLGNTPGIPMWVLSHVYGREHVNPEFFSHVLNSAQRMSSFPAMYATPAHELYPHELIRIASDMATAICRSCPWRTDLAVDLIVDRDPNQSMSRSHKRGPSPVVVPRERFELPFLQPTDTAPSSDCDDRAFLVGWLLRVLMILEIDQAVHPLLHAVQQTLRLYIPVNILCTANNDRGLHFTTVLFPIQSLSQVIKDALIGNPIPPHWLDHPHNHGAHLLPALVDGTADLPVFAQHEDADEFIPNPQSHKAHVPEWCMPLFDDLIDTGLVSHPEGVGQSILNTAIIGYTHYKNVPVIRFVTKGDDDEIIGGASMHAMMLGVASMETLGPLTDDQIAVIEEGVARHIPPLSTIKPPEGKHDVGPIHTATRDAVMDAQGTFPPDQGVPTNGDHVVFTMPADDYTHEITAILTKHKHKKHIEVYIIAIAPRISTVMIRVSPRARKHKHK